MASEVSGLWPSLTADRPRRAPEVSPVASASPSPFVSPPESRSPVATKTTPTSPRAWRPDVTAYLPADVIPDALILTHAIVAGRRG